MTKRYILTLLFLFTQFTFLWAQSYKEHRGDIAFNQFNYNKAIEKYMQVLEAEPDNYFVMLKLAESYKQMGNDTAAVNYYKKHIAYNQYENQTLYDYSIALKDMGAYDESGKILEQYNKAEQQKHFLLNSEFAEQLKSGRASVKISLVENSSPSMDFSPAYFGDKIIFISSRQGTNMLQKEYERDGEPFLQLFVADTINNGQLSNIVPFDSRLNTKFHEGPVSFCEADSTMYFTRNNYNIFKGLSSKGEVNLKVYSSKFTYSQWLKSIDNLMDSIGFDVNLEQEDWRRVKEFQHNSKEYSVGHPSLTADGRFMYFASNMPGGKGGTDIYYAIRRGPQEWSDPINLSELNTEGDEMFPFIHPSGVLFFASDGLAGLGGLDVFKARPKGSRFNAPENLKAPINSMADDFGLIADKETKTGYFSSNRAGGKGMDDLYYVLFNFRPEAILAGTVYEKGSKVSIPEANLTLKNTEDGSVQELIADENGRYSTSIIYTQNYEIAVEKGLYMPVNRGIDPSQLTKINDTLYSDVEMEFYGIYGAVFQKESNTKVPGVTITATPIAGGEAIVVVSDENGDFKTLLEKDTEYNLVFTKENFFTLKESFSTINRNVGWYNINEFIELSIEAIEVGKTIEIPNIYYDLAKWNIRDDAALELKKVVEFMTDNPTIVIELGSHTDARGSNASNQSLSQKRAVSAVDYIVNTGIAKERIVAKGYGENRLKNHCADGVKCNEEEHQANRRTEITITSF